GAAPGPVTSFSISQMAAMYRPARTAAIQVIRAATPMSPTSPCTAYVRLRTVQARDGASYAFPYLHLDGPFGRLVHRPALDSGRAGAFRSGGVSRTRTRSRRTRGSWRSTSTRPAAAASWTASPRPAALAG